MRSPSKAGHSRLAHLQLKSLDLIFFLSIVLHEPFTSKVSVNSHLMASSARMKGRSTYIYVGCINMKRECEVKQMVKTEVVIVILRRTIEILMVNRIGRERNVKKHNLITIRLQTNEQFS